MSFSQGANCVRSQIDTAGRWFGSPRRTICLVTRAAVAAGQRSDWPGIQAARAMPAAFGSFDHHWGRRQRLHLQHASHFVLRADRTSSDGRHQYADPVCPGILPYMLAAQLSQPLIHGRSQYNTQPDTCTDQGCFGATFAADHDHDRNGPDWHVCARRQRGGRRRFW
jgi:hypothetical protein